MSLGDVMSRRPTVRRFLASPHLAGHVLHFEPRAAPGAPTSTVGLLLACALLLESSRLTATALLSPGGSTVPRAAILAPLGLFAAVLVLSALGPSARRDLGLRGWSAWSPTERSYGIQVALLAAAVFALVLGPPRAERVLPVFVPYLCFGFYQELVYRGLVQAALVRRWGALVGVLVANGLYTFGPLHWSYLSRPLAPALLLFAATFAIGLYFGALYHRSGNLWLPATFHAIGNAFIVTRLAGNP